MQRLQRQRSLFATDVEKVFKFGRFIGETDFKRVVLNGEILFFQLINTSVINGGIVLSLMEEDCENEKGDG